MGDRLVKKGLVCGIIVLFIGTNLVSGLNIQLKNTTYLLITGRGNTLYVGGSGPGNYTKIQDAIDDARDGDTVFVYNDSSPYYENVEVYKSINLIGEDKNTTIINGSYNGDVVTIVSDWVNISGFSIQDGFRSGIYNIISNHTIITGNNIILNHWYGIYVSHSSGNTITDNNLSMNDDDGVFLFYSCSNIITNNNISNNHEGVELDDSSYNIITGNKISNNEWGIGLGFSIGNTITGNTMVDNGISIWGNKLVYWNTHIIDTSNTVNSKPIIYWKDQIGGTIPTSAGEFILANCTNVVIENQYISGGDVGIQLGFSSDCTIKGNNISSNNGAGIDIDCSSGNTITGNNISNNEVGIYIRDSFVNTITSNNISNNLCGIGLQWSNGNTITGNNISSNNDYGILLDQCGDYGVNKLKGNNISNNGYGICTHTSENSIITGNNIISNYEYGIEVEFSFFTLIKKNNLIDNKINAKFIESYGTRWIRNYWDDWSGIGPYIIHGLILDPYYYKSWINFDWHPAKEPYNITTTQGCDIV
jgi:parallel beta-helix repeat protein